VRRIHHDMSGSHRSPVLSQLAFFLMVTCVRSTPPLVEELIDRISSLSTFSLVVLLRFLGWSLEGRAQNVGLESWQNHSWYPRSVSEIWGAVEVKESCLVPASATAAPTSNANRHCPIPLYVALCFCRKPANAPEHIFSHHGTMLSHTNNVHSFALGCNVCWKHV
jgi:hypothetical protein